MNNPQLINSQWKHIKEKKFNLAILPWGATEAHNYHLPYGTDIYEAEAFGRESVKRANKNGAKAIVLPVIPFGVNTGQTDISLCINLNPSTQMKILEDVICSVQNSGIRKFLILNSHGGNDFKQMIRELGTHFPEMILTVADWYHATDRTKFFENEGDHADEMETSLLLYLHPELVLPLSEAGEGKHKKFRIKALNEKWAWAERKWTQVSEDTGIGNPKKATAEKGEKFFNAVCDKMAAFITELSLIEKEKFYL